MMMLGAALLGVLVSLLPNQVYAMDWTNAIIGTLSGDFLQGTLIAALSHVLLVLAGWWVSLTAGLLDVSISATLNMADLVNNTPSIGIMWRSIRDLSNIALIGVMLFASIRTILGLTGKDLSNTIKNVIICGLFINFSLFATRVMIDGSNLVALTFYDAIKPYDDYSISDTIMQKLKIQSFFSMGTVSSIGNSIAGNESFTTKALITGMGAVTVMTMIGFLFLGAAITMVYRLVILLLCMAFSPLYFIALVLPQTADARKQLEDTFYKQLFAGPTMLMVLYVGLKIVDSMSFGQNTQFANIFQGSGAVNKTVGDFANFAIGGPGTIAAFFNYALVIIVLGAALGISQKSGGYGGAMANKWFEDFSKWGQGKIKSGMRGTNSFIFRQSVGRGASALAESGTLNRFSQNNPLLGRIATNAIKGVAKPYEEAAEKRAETRVAFAEGLGFDKAAVKKLMEDRDNHRINNVEPARTALTEAKINSSSLKSKLKEAKKRLTEADEKLKAARASGDQGRIRAANDTQRTRASEFTAAETDYNTATLVETNAKTQLDTVEAELDTKDKEIAQKKIERQTNVADVHRNTFLRSFADKHKGVPFIGRFIDKFDSAEAKAAKELDKKQRQLDLADAKEAVADLKKEIAEFEKRKRDPNGLTPSEESKLQDLRKDYDTAAKNLAKLERDNL